VSAVAVLLIAVGVADAWRWSIRGRWLPLVLLPVVVVVCALLAGLWHRGDIPLLLIAAAAGVGWEWLCARAEGAGAHQGAPLALFAAAVGALILLSGWASGVTGLVARWSAWVRLAGAHEVSPNRVLMVVGVVLLQVVTGNQLVRLVLASVGAVRPAGEPQPSERLRGGRLLGPMERLLILGLGLGGQAVVATAVIAAKSLIRFPELNAQKAANGGGSGVGANGPVVAAEGSVVGAEGSVVGAKGSVAGGGGVDRRVGIDALTEYFLVGSFASWIVALGGLALVVPSG
jgi:hypothetical protein